MNKNKTTQRGWIALLSGMALAACAPVLSADSPLDAKASDPRVMGWMQGFPPPKDRLITQPDANYFSFPKLRWSVCHLREFLPTEEISRGLGAPVPLEYLDPDALEREASAIDALTFTPWAATVK